MPDGPDMTEFGFPEANPGASQEDEDLESLLSPQEEPEEEAEPEAEEAVEAVAEEPAEAEGEAEEEEEEPAAELTPEQILEEVTRAFPSSDEPAGAITSEELNRVLDERLAKLAERDEKPPPAKPVDEDEQEYAAYEQILRATPEEDRPAVIAQFQRLREQKLAERQQAQVSEVQKAQQERARLVQQYQQLKGNLDQGLQAAWNKGGLQKAVVEQFVRSGDYQKMLQGQYGTSMLSQLLSTTPGAVYAATGVLNAVQSSVQWIQELYANQQNQPQEDGEPVPQGAERKTTAVPAKGKAAPATKKKSSADPYAKAISDAGSDTEQALAAIGWK